MSKTTAPRAATPPRRTRIEPGIYRRQDGELEIGWRDADGKQRWRVIPGRKLKTARTALAEEHARRGRGERTAADPRLHFDGAADAWWLARVLMLAPNTQNAYGAGLRHLRKVFGRRRMTTITVSDIVRYVATKRAAGLKGWTIAGHLTVLSAIFRYANRHLGLQVQNPVALLDDIERPSTDDEKPKRILTAEELAALLGALEEDYVELFELAAETGMRLSEVLAVQWHELELDPDLASIDIRFQLSRARRGRAARRVKLKTRRSQRVLEITPSLARRLLARKLTNRLSTPHSYVFATRDGTPHDQRNIGGRVLSRAVRKAGLGKVVDRGGEIVVPAPTFHALRHTHASRLIAEGWDIEEISARLGHANVATTQRIYVHEFDRARRSRDRRAKLARLYGTDRVEASMEAEDGSRPQQAAAAGSGEVVRLPTESGVAA